MATSIGKRLGQLALLTVALFGAVLVPLFLRGMYYVQPNADNWRLLPYVVPAARYELMVQNFSILHYDFADSKVQLTCYDGQDRPIRRITHEDAYGLTYMDYHYEGNVTVIQSVDVGMQHSTLRITTDELGREIRTDYADGSYCIMEYEGDRTECSASFDYDAQGMLTSKMIRIFDGDTVYRREEDGTGKLLAEDTDTIDVHGNITASYGWYLQEDGTRKDFAQQQRWTYDDTERRETVRRAYGMTERFWYDAQERLIRQETDIEDGILYSGITIEYTDITRR